MFVFQLYYYGVIYAKRICNTSTSKNVRERPGKPKIQKSKTAEPKLLTPLKQTKVTLTRLTKKYMKRQIKNETSTIKKVQQRMSKRLL